MDEKIANSIFVKQSIINEVKDIKRLVTETIDDSVKLTITTRHNMRTYGNVTI